MHESPWITIFGSWVGRFAKNFHEWKSLANRFTSDPKIVIHGKECITLFLTRYFMFWTHSSIKSNYQSLISPLSLRTVFSDLALWRHHSWSLTSHERGVLALWSHIRRLFLHVHIGAKAIFTVTTVIIDFSPPGIHASVCKKCILFTVENLRWICKYFTVSNTMENL